MRRSQLHLLAARPFSSGSRPPRRRGLPLLRLGIADNFSDLVARLAAADFFRKGVITSLALLICRPFGSATCCDRACLSSAICVSIRVFVSFCGAACFPSPIFSGCICVSVGRRSGVASVNGVWEIKVKQRHPTQVKRTRFSSSFTRPLSSSFLFSRNNSRLLIWHVSSTGAAWWWCCRVDEFLQTRTRTFARLVFYTPLFLVRALFAELSLLWESGGRWREGGRSDVIGSSSAISEGVRASFWTDVGIATRRALSWSA